MIKDAWNTAIDISEGCYCWSFVNLRCLNSGGNNTGYYDDHNYGNYPVQKNKWLAAILSFIIVGAGQIYCAFGIEERDKQIGKGILYLAIFIGMFFVIPIMIVIIRDQLIMMVLILIWFGWWLQNIVDAYHTAEEITNGSYVWSFFK